MVLHIFAAYVKQNVQPVSPVPRNEAPGQSFIVEEVGESFRVTFSIFEAKFVHLYNNVRGGGGGSSTHSVFSPTSHTLE